MRERGSRRDLKDEKEGLLSGVDKNDDNKKELTSGEKKTVFAMIILTICVILIMGLKHSVGVNSLSETSVCSLNINILYHTNLIVFSKHTYNTKTR